MKADRIQKDNFTAEKYAWETYAGEALAWCLGEYYSFRHLGRDSNSYDGALDHLNVQRYAIEITRCCDSESLKFMQALDSNETGQVLDLADGSGAWIADLEIGTRVRQHRIVNYQYLIDELNSEEIQELMVGTTGQWRKAQSMCKALGIGTVRRAPFEGDFLYRHAKIDISNPFLNTSSEILFTELQSILDSDRMSAKVEKLHRRSGDLDEVLVLSCEGGFSLSAQFAMSGIGQAFSLPIGPLAIPTGLSEVWLIAVGRRALRYSLAASWSEFDLSKFSASWRYAA